MYFTRDVKTKIQQDTYIQRARMFGARGKYLPHFELTIPRQLYEDWHRCFVFHKLALDAIKKDKVSPVWLGDPRIAVVASSSIDRATVNMDRGEMSFPLFPLPQQFRNEIDKFVTRDPEKVSTLKQLARKLGDGLPQLLC